MNNKVKSYYIAGLGSLVAVAGCMGKKIMPKTSAFVSGIGIGHVAAAGILYLDSENGFLKKINKTVEKKFL